MARIVDTDIDIAGVQATIRFYNGSVIVTVNYPDADEQYFELPPTVAYELGLAMSAAGHAAKKRQPLRVVE